MKQFGFVLGALVFCALLAVSCKKKIDLPHVPSVPSVVLAGNLYAETEDGTLQSVGIAETGKNVLAYLNTDLNEQLSIAEIRRAVQVSDDVPADFVHVFSPADDADYWVKNDFLVLGASPVVLLEDKPFCPSLTNNPAQFAETKIVIPAHTIVAVHHVASLLDYLQVSWLADGEVQTGFIENPHPFFSTNENDAIALRLYREAASLPDEEKEAKKSLLDNALSLEIAPSMRNLIQPARKALDPPPAPKPNVSYERVKIPTTLSGGAKSRYGVNMGELLTGGTEDPWAKNTR